MKKIKISVATMCCLAMSSTVASATVFPDVPDGHIFQQSVEQLFSSGIVGGNPNGLFLPNNAVNRAEMLKMLYKAAGKNADQSSVNCFSDVVSGSWYESYVCDAAANGYVSGYGDKTFKPAKEVNKVEALKMITKILDIEVGEISTEERDAIKFVDVSTSSWYTKYLYAAFQKGILPIPGQGGSHFFPDSPLLRGEAAAYIYNALNVEFRQDKESSSSSTDNSNDDSSSSTNNNSSVASSSSRITSTEVPVDFPFDKTGKFNDKKSYSYLFTLNEVKTMFIDSSVNVGGLTCRLYLLPESGFSEEYYLGHEEGKNCFLLVTLPEGNYQLQLKPTVADATFAVDATESTGDNNDGFREAKRLLKEVPKSSFLGVNDIQDFYMFEVTSETTMTVESTNPLEIGCSIFPMSNVDLFGFSGPECNQSYSYPPGTYYVSVGRTIATRTSQKSYTLTLR